MTFTYENQGTSTFLVYKVQLDDEIDTMSLGMLTNNQIDGIAPTQFGQMDNDKYIKYNVSAKVSADQLLSGPVNKKRLLGVFNGIIDAMLSAEDYMLDPNSLLLELEHIYVDVSSCEAFVICLPILNSERKNPDLGAFFKNLIISTQFDQTENCDHIAQLLTYLNGAPYVDIHDFKRVLEQIEKPAVAALKANAVHEQPKVALEPQKVRANVQPVVPVNHASAPAHTPVAPVNHASAPVHTPVVSPKPVNSAPAKTDVAPKQPVPQPQNRMAVPGAGAAPGISRVPQAAPAPKTAPAADTSEKEMSWFYLMQHYNAENAAIYKAQQEAKKEKQGKKKSEAAPKTVPAMSQPAAPAYAVPGQQPARPVQQVVTPPQQTVMQQPSVEQPQRAAVMPQQTVQQPRPQAAPISFGETTVLSAATYGETTVLSGASEPTKRNPFLVRAKNNEKIDLNKPVFRIGKERSFVDYFIGDNTAISRSHANIVNRDGEFFVVDTNSTNHTYVNGGMINSNMEVKLAHGDKVRLANEEFEFRLY